MDRRKLGTTDTFRVECADNMANGADPEMVPYWKEPQTASNVIDVPIELDDEDELDLKAADEAMREAEEHGTRPIEELFEEEGLT